MIISIGITDHDQGIYDGNIHLSIERFTRNKENRPFSNEDLFFYYFYNLMRDNKENIICFTSVKDYLESIPSMEIFLNYQPRHLDDYIFKDNLYYIDHHQSHASLAFHQSGFDEADIFVADGWGLEFGTIFIDSNGYINNLSKMGLGRLWNVVSDNVNTDGINCGKLMGLAGYGKIDESIYLLIDELQKCPTLDSGKFPDRLTSILKEYDTEDVARTMQQYTLDAIEEQIIPLKTSNNICLAGGVAYNGYMNELFTKYYDNVFVTHAPGDEGQSIGAYMHYKYTQEGIKFKPNVYSGIEYEIE